jgi:hypothetical protein
MKISLLLVVLLFAVAVTSGSAPLASNPANLANKERAEVTFGSPVQLMGITLKGQYLFVHDDAAMARGETCTFVYKGSYESHSKLVASFHCMPAFRDRVAHFTLRTELNSRGEAELVEYQFGGSAEAHMVPNGHYAGHLTIASVN